MCLFSCQKFSCKKICALRNLCIAINNLCQAIDIEPEVNSALEYQELFVELSEVLLSWKRRRDESRRSTGANAFGGERVMPTYREEISRKAENTTN